MPSLSGTGFSETQVNERSQSQVPSTQDLPYPVPQIRVHPPQEQVYGINHFEGIESKRMGQNVPNTIKKIVSLVQVRIHQIMKQKLTSLP